MPHPAQWPWRTWILIGSCLIVLLTGLPVVTSAAAAWTLDLQEHVTLPPRVITLADLVNQPVPNPAGSIVLTGTPGGTAVRTPGALTKMRLLVEGGFSAAGARAEWVEESEAAAERQGYLAPGDIVETSIQCLGCQRWTVVGSEPDRTVEGRDDRL